MIISHFLLLCGLGAVSGDWGDVVGVNELDEGVGGVLDSGGSELDGSTGGTDDGSVDGVGLVGDDSGGILLKVN